MRRGRLCRKLIATARLRDKLGQHTAEFALLIGLVSAVAIGTQLLTRQAMRYGLKVINDRTLSYFGAEPSLVKKDEKSKLRWSVPGASGCEAHGDWSGNKAPI